jgi:hypothetical protein
LRIAASSLAAYKTLLERQGDDWRRHIKIYDFKDHPTSFAAVNAEKRMEGTW